MRTNRWRDDADAGGRADERIDRDKRTVVIEYTRIDLGLRWRNVCPLIACYTPGRARRRLRHRARIVTSTSTTEVRRVTPLRPGMRIPAGAARRGRSAVQSDQSPRADGAHAIGSGDDGGHAISMPPSPVPGLVARASRVAQVRRSSARQTCLRVLEAAGISAAAQNVSAK